MFDVYADTTPPRDRIKGHAAGMRQIETQRAAVLIVRDERLAVFVIYESHLIRGEREIGGNDLPQNSAPRDKPAAICGTVESLGPLIFILRKKRSQFRDQVRRLIERRPPNMRFIGAER